MFLTTAELADLTGRTQSAAQKRWLAANGYPVAEDADGRPRVLRDVVLARLGGLAQTARMPRLRLPTR